MNKFYIINYRLPNGYLISCHTFWNYYEAKQMMVEACNWDYELVESNDTHMIWEAE
jgi:hypothetical protein